MLFFKNQKREYEKLKDSLKAEIKHCFVDNGVGEGPLKATGIDFFFLPAEFDRKIMKDLGLSINVLVETNYDHLFATEQSRDSMMKSKTMVNGELVAESEIIGQIFKEFRKKIDAFARDCVSRSRFKYKKNVIVNSKYKDKNVQFYVDLFTEDHVALDEMTRR